MARKTKAKAPAFEAAQSKQDAARRIGTVGELRRQLLVIETEQSTAIAKIKEQAEAKAAQIKEQLAQEEPAVQAWCEANREKLTLSGKKKSFDFGSGIVRWRTRPPAVRLRGIADVIERLRSLGFAEFLRQKTEVDKDAVLKNPEKASAIAGITIISGVEDFVIEPVDEKLSETLVGGKSEAA